MPEGISVRERPTGCRHFYPRKLVRCKNSVEFVIDYASGVGVCSQHLGDQVKWCLEDHASVEVFTIEMWENKIRWDE